MNEEFKTVDHFLDDLFAPGTEVASVDEPTEEEIELYEQERILELLIVIGLQASGVLVPETIVNQIKATNEDEFAKLPTHLRGPIAEQDLPFFAAISEVTYAASYPPSSDGPDEMALAARDQAMGHILASPDQIISTEQKGRFITFVNEFLSDYMLPLDLTSDEARQTHLATVHMAEAEHNLDLTRREALDHMVGEILVREFGAHDDIEQVSKAIRLASSWVMMHLTPDDLPLDIERVGEAVTVLRTTQQVDNLEATFTSGLGIPATRFVELTYAYTRAYLAGDMLL